MNTLRIHSLSPRRPASTLLTPAELSLLAQLEPLSPEASAIRDREGARWRAAQLAAGRNLDFLLPGRRPQLAEASPR